MAKLRAPSGELVWICSHHTIGRHPDNLLVLPSDSVSGQHAVIRWQAAGWMVRDLGSRNGTRLNGTRLQSGTSARLRADDELRFADEGEWTVHDADPPEPMAVPLPDGPACVGHRQILGFPDAEHPAAQVVRAGTGWAMEEEGDARAVRDGEVVEVAGSRWRLSLPRSIGRTVDFAKEPEPLSLRFEVSLDEEHVRLIVRSGQQVRRLKSRVHHYTLLTLARQRLEDAEVGLPAPEQGWLSQEDLERMLRLERNVLYQHIYRARRELAEVVNDSQIELVERRHDAGQLRLGVSHLEVQRLG